MGRTFIHPSKGNTHVSPPRCAAVCVQDSGLNSASSGTEDSFLLVHVRSVSVNVAAFFILRAVLVHPLETHALPKHFGRQGTCSLD